MIQFTFIFLDSTSIGSLSLSLSLSLPLSLSLFLSLCLYPFSLNSDLLSSQISKQSPKPTQKAGLEFYFFSLLNFSFGNNTSLYFLEKVVRTIWKTFFPQIFQKKLSSDATSFSNIFMYFLYTMIFYYIVTI
jgi:hypothetical protein